MPISFKKAAHLGASGFWTPYFLIVRVPNTEAPGFEGLQWLMTDLSVAILSLVPDPAPK